MDNKEIIKILKEMKFDYEKQISDHFVNDYTIWRAKRYLKCINEILKMLEE